MNLFNIDELPISSVDEIFNAVQNNEVPEWFLKCVDFDMSDHETGKWSFASFVNNQTVLPPVVEDMYEKTADGKYIFPAKRKNATLVVGQIGDQTSMYHLETTQQHFFLTCGRMWLRDASDEEVLCGMLHDAGKKYTLGSNQRGEICFYGHEKVSALFAAVVLTYIHTLHHQQKYDIVRAIYDHMKPFVWKTNHDDETDYIEKNGLYAACLVREINDVDVGITDKIIIENLDRLSNLDHNKSIEIEDEETKKTYIELYVGKTIVKDLDRIFPL